MKFRDELIWIIPLAAVCILVFLNSLSGEFVYDDLRVVLRNPLIQDNKLIWSALTSDAWAFKGGGTMAASNYWRPTFTAWHILNFRLFGSNPLGWHIASLFLHFCICILAYALLRRWAFSSMLAAAIVLIFAVHPTRVEVVAWVSGSPDLLFALSFLGSLWFVQSYAAKKNLIYLIPSLVLYGIALGSKEIAIVCLPIYYFVAAGKNAFKKESISALLPLVVHGMLAAAYFLVRWSVLGAIARPADDAVGTGTAIMSLPSMFAFYLRQIVFPFWIGPNYPLEPAVYLGFWNFLLPLAVSAAAVIFIIYAAFKTQKGKLAAALFFLPLLPAMNATAFTPEQIVHDRYLYLPLLGLLMLAVSYAAKFVTERSILIAAIILSIPLAVQTFRYNRAWANELALWSWSAAEDDSSFSSMQHGAALLEAKRNDEAIAAFTKSINKKPSARGYLGRARGHLNKKQYANAEQDLINALQLPVETIEPYALYQTYESLGIVQGEQGKMEDAARTFRKARTVLPMYSAAITVKLAIALYQTGRKADALAELEPMRVQARRELLPESKEVFLRIGMLYAEQGRRDEARTTLLEYLSLTQGSGNETIAAERAEANRFLEMLK